MTDHELEICAVAADRWPKGTPSNQWYSYRDGQFDGFNQNVVKDKLQYG